MEISQIVSMDKDFVGDMLGMQLSFAVIPWVGIYYCRKTREM